MIVLPAIFLAMSSRNEIKWGPRPFQYAFSAMIVLEALSLVWILSPLSHLLYHLILTYLLSPQPRILTTAPTPL